MKEIGNMRGNILKLPLDYPRLCFALNALFSPLLCGYYELLSIARFKKCITISFLSTGSQSAEF